MEELGPHFRVSAHLQYLQRKLTDMAQSHQVAFAAWCCERLYPWYSALACFLRLAEAGLLRYIIDRIWGHVGGRPLARGQVDEFHEQCENLELGDEGCSIFRQAAMDAVGATWLALEACHGDGAKNAAKAGECSINRVDREIMAEVWQLYNRPLGPSDFPTVERQVTLHPAMQFELELQSKVLELLENTPHLGNSEIETLMMCSAIGLRSPSTATATALGERAGVRNRFSTGA